jgi:hypothetical protein
MHFSFELKAEAEYTCGNIGGLTLDDGNFSVSARNRGKARKIAQVLLNGGVSAPFTRLYILQFDRGS